MEKLDLKKAGLKVTLPRMKILEILQNADKKHLSAEDIYKRLLEAGEEIGLATVYRVLTQFEAANLVTRHHFEGGQAVFELEQGEHHDHLVCIKCGKVEEFLNETIESCQQKIADNAGYRITDHSLIIYGVCPDCQEREKEGGKR
ncbi:MAG TPA: ferric iron uptake transcriptional regulator [Chromatiales bacterium]|nr:ferric iron uptake transcriptional regulator [Chromatiales bacterium]